MDIMYIVWMVTAGVFLVLELLTAAMCSIWFTAGAVAALAACALGGPVWLQILVFFIVSGVCFALLYPRLKKYVSRTKHATNADMVIGQTCVVTQVIDNLSGTGTVAVGGKTWTARSSTGEAIEEGRLVTAERIEGVKLIVSPVTENATV